ncbi:unnamed protein product [Rhizophagus irregularis]|nr:unnamed protein product [Rhizophagus irregularis]
MNILNYRSSYLRSILSTIERRNDGTLIQIKLPNILPEIFQIILRYIYGGSLPLEEYDALDVIKILVAASELSLQELIFDNHINKKLSDEMPQYQENYGQDNSAQVPKSQVSMKILTKYSCFILTLLLYVNLHLPYHFYYKDKTIEEPVKLASKSTSGSASSSQTTVELDSKKICKSIVNMVEEYFSILDSQEVIACFKEDIPVEYHPKAIETFANKVFEKKQRDVDDVMKLFKEIVSSSACDNDAFKDGFKATLEFLMDIGVDAPMAYSYTGQLLFSTELEFRDITELLKPLDDDMAIDKIVKGYAKALKNDVDEQKYVQSELS